MAEAEVDTETGFVRVKRIVCVQDCGLVVNRLASISQIKGGIILGIGFALYEEPGRICYRSYLEKEHIG